MSGEEPVGKADSEVSNANGSKWIRPEKRLAIYHRDGFACVYCGATEGEALLSLDHVTPRELGGTHDATNLVTACVSCNSVKRDASNRDFFALLRDRGVDTSALSARIRKHAAREVDLAAGKQILENRKAGGR